MLAFFRSLIAPSQAPLPALPLPLISLSCEFLTLNELIYYASLTAEDSIHLSGTPLSVEAKALFIQATHQQIHLVIATLKHHNVPLVGRYSDPLPIRLHKTIRDRIQERETLRFSTRSPIKLLYTLDTLTLAFDTPSLIQADRAINDYMLHKALSVLENTPFNARHMHLEYLGLTRFPLELVDYLRRYPFLVAINLSYNPLRRLPESFSHLQQLRSLDVTCAKLSDLPDSFLHLPNLRRLDLSYNRFHRVPRCLPVLERRQPLRIDLSHNPLPPPKRSLRHPPISSATSPVSAITPLFRRMQLSNNARPRPLQHPPHTRAPKFRARL